MSASIFFRQIKPIEKNEIPCDTPSNFIQSLERAFGQFPTALTEKHISTLAGMAAVEGGVDNNVYDILINKIRKYKEIEVFAQW